MPALVRQLCGLGGCTRPVRLDGHRTEHQLDPRAGEIGRALHHLDSTALPAGHLLVRCNNRRATRCAACAEVYRRDAYQLITAGLRGGKGNPESVAAHPRVFATFTAPGFGPVHNRPTTKGGSRKCRCGARHDEDAPELGTPLGPATYDYEAAVLWNAHAGMLWRLFSIYLRREVAKRAGLTQRDLPHFARVSFAKVAEYQKRGAVHFHAVIRTAWRLGARKDLAELRLRAWAHMLGFRGHFSTKTRRYSTTLGALRDARAEWRRAQVLGALPDDRRPAEHDQDEETTYVLAHWVFAGIGLTRGEEWLSASLAPALGTEGEPTHG